MTPTRRQPVRCLCTPHNRTLVGEGKRGVQTRLFCILCQGMWGMWRVVLSLATVGTSPGVRLGQAIYSQNRDGYEVQGCGRGRGGSEVWLHARVLSGCEARCEILGGHGAGSDKHKDKQSQRCRAPIIGFAAAIRRRESPLNGLQHGAGSGQHAGKQIWRCCAPIVGFAAARPL